jgi:AraC family transcriptional regulator, regulatory protein of adaptative response / DNA-3-methyladenine glycosylase II
MSYCARAMPSSDLPDRCGAEPLRQDAQTSGNRYTVELSYRPPLDWNFFLSFHRARMIAGVEYIDDQRYRRVISHAGHHGLMEIGPGLGNTLAATIEFALESAIPYLIERLRWAFDLDADPLLIGQHLATDPVLRDLIVKRPGLRIARAFDPFEQGVRAILGQQISVVAAIKLATRMTERWGDAVQFSAAPDLSRAFPDAIKLAEADIATLGMPRSRAATINNFARAVLADPTLLQPSATLDESIAKLKALKGFGDWTAHYLAMRALREPDAFPASDVGLLRALPGVDGQRLQAAQLLDQAERWRPWRAYAAQHLWAQDAEKGT